MSEPPTVPRSEAPPRHCRAAAVRRIGLGALAATALMLCAAAAVLDWSLPARAAIIGGVCVALWLSEWVPVWVPTLVVWGATPLLLGRSGEDFQPLGVLAWSADPVLVLFFGGFALAAAASRQGADRSVAALALRLSRGHAMRTIALAAFATAALSMWMSNIAAAALMLGAFRPVLDEEPPGGSLRRGLLLAIALAADVGGIATPIGSGPNGIAIAAMERYRPITFVHWMAFGVPLTLGLVAAVLVLVAVWIRPAGRVLLPPGSLHVPPGRIRALGAVFGVTVLLWLTESVHGVRAWVIALAAAGALVVPGPPAPARPAGARLVHAGADRRGNRARCAPGPFRAHARDRGAAPLRLRAPHAAPPGAVPAQRVALRADEQHRHGDAAGPPGDDRQRDAVRAVLVAVAASLGVPFVISTPPNAMAFGAGLRARDLLVPGLVIMLAGCLLVALTGPWVLRAVGIP